MQNLQLFGFDNDLNSVPGKERGPHVTNGGLSREEKFPDVANFGTRGKRRHRASPFLALGTSVMPSSSPPPKPSPLFPLCLRHLLQEPNCVYHYTIPLQYCNASIVSCFYNPQSISLLPTGSEQLAAEGVTQGLTG